MRSRAGLVVAFLVALMLPASFSNAHGNSDLLLPSQGHGDDKVVSAAGDDAKPWPCCDFCVCTKSIPPQCRCSDVLIGGCDSNCKKCFCTKSIPPQCQCRDVIYDYCGDSCTDP